MRRSARVLESSDCGIHPGSLWKELDMNRITDAEEVAGHGISVRIDGRNVLIGNEKLMKEKAIFYEPCKSIGTVVYVAGEGKFLGSIVIADTVKDGAKRRSPP